MSGLAVIDSHHHLWDRRRAAYPWLGPQLPMLDREVLFDELAPLLRAAGIARTVLVQGADNDDDTDFLLEQAAAHDEIAAVVAWIPLDDPERAAARLSELRRHPKFRGIRHGINAEPDPEWILRPEVTEGLRLLEDEDIPFDYVPVRRRHLELVPELVERHPRLRIVIDHLSKPPVLREEREPWWTNIARAAEAPTVSAKVSGLMPAGGDFTRWEPDDLRPFVDRALECFGPERPM
ncbi:MAG: amidohydrolase family protein, partial [Microbacteriaceae bacterium]|nr:amidohydrolase family protein [Microbacteriaceae bacterium]